MKKITFKQHLDASNFTSYLVSQNKDHEQILYDYDGGAVVSYELHGVIRGNLQDRIDARIKEGQIL